LFDNEYRYILSAGITGAHFFLPIKEVAKHNLAELNAGTDALPFI
jgi:hypothetical protein